jgi:hypothetical protein
MPQHLYGWHVFAVEFRDGSDVRRFLQDLTCSFRDQSYRAMIRYTGIDLLVKGQLPRYVFACLWVKLAN